ADRNALLAVPGAVAKGEPEPNLAPHRPFHVLDGVEAVPADVRLLPARFLVQTLDNSEPVLLRVACLVLTKDAFLVEHLERAIQTVAIGDLRPSALRRLLLAEFALDRSTEPGFMFAV